MASTINLSGLNHYMSSLKKYEILLSDFSGAMAWLCENVKKYAEEQYKQYGHSDIEVSYSPNGTFATIYAKGEQVAFFEFGTGDVGNGTYPDPTIVPTSGVPITGEWVYYYENPKTKRTSHGIRGWFWDNRFQRGNPAEAEMWKTAQYIKTNSGIILRAYFTAKGGG